MSEPEENLDKKYNKSDWVEKFRPKTVKQVILPKTYKRFFLGVVESTDLPNLLIHSSIPGSGKTALAKALCRDLGIKYLYINLSLERGIDTLRSTIQSFATMRSISGKYKCVIMDECDGATKELQDALKVAVEEYHSSCRFIMLCNNVNKLNKALRQGRVMEFDFNMSSVEFQSEMKPHVTYYLKKMLEHEKVSYEEETVKALVDKHYPSIRTCISMLHQFYLLNGCINNNILSFQDIDDEFFELLFKKKVEAARKYIIERNIPYNDIYGLLFRKFLPKVHSSLKGELIKIIDEQQYRNSLVLDQEIAMASCLVKIMEIL
jgi:DNA polymerase III delta prime subunit